MSNISVEPDTIVKLLRCGLQRGSGHQLTFANATAQQTYFESRVLYSYTDFTYVRENNSIAVGQNVEDIRDCNYLMYQNKNFGNSKWFYAFVTDLEYVNENCTRVYFEIDSWQTWVWDIDLHPVFIEREHTNDDTVGANTVPEALDTGEYICDFEARYAGMDNLCYLVFATSDDAGLRYPDHIGKIPSCGPVWVCDNYKAVNSLINDYASSSGVTTEAIILVYMVPRTFVDFNWAQWDNLQDEEKSTIYLNQDTVKTDTFTLQKPTSNGTYTPRNKKLLTNPFVYLLASNNNGSSNIMKYEDFTSNSCIFEIVGVPTVGGSIKLTPTHFIGGEQNNSLIAGKFPVCNWAGDAYINWLTQNSVNIATQSFSSAIQAITGGAFVALGGATGNMAGVISGTQQVASAITSIGQAVSTDKQHKMEPDVAKGNINCGDVNVCNNNNTFYLYRMSIKEEMAKIIDEYFDMFGYKTNRVKYPNLGMTLNNTNYKGRLNWNYVKTIGCTFDAKNSSKMSRQDEINIQQMFDNGVTLWHNPATMYNYSQANTIVS